MNKRNYAFDFLKVFLVFVVVIHHSSALTSVPHRGYMSVDCFFIVSGYLIARTQTMHSDMKTWEYLKRRLASLYPAYLFAYVCIAVVYFFCGKFIYDRSYGALLEVFLLQDVFMVSNSINYPMWYLSVLITAGTIIYMLLKKLPRKVFNPLALLMVAVIYVWHWSRGGIEQWAMALRVIYPPFWRGTASILVGTLLFRFQGTRLHRLFTPIAKWLEVFSFTAMMILICTPGRRLDYYVLAAIILLVFSLTFPDPLLARAGKTKAISFLIRHEYAIYLHHALFTTLCQMVINTLHLPYIMIVPMLLISLPLFAPLSDLIVDSSMSVIRARLNHKKNA